MANESEGSGGIPNWIFATVGVVGIVGFMFWLSSAAQPGQLVAIVEEDTTVVTSSTGEVVTLDQVAADASALAGRDVTIESIEVTAALGQQAFWIDLPSQQPFLIRMTGSGSGVEPGDRLTVTGRIVEMTDSIITDWLASGVINENQEPEARFAQSFLEASTVRSAQ